MSNAFEDLPPRLKVAEVAGALGRSERSIRNWIKSGELKAYKPGGAWLITRDDLIAFIEQTSNQEETDHGQRNGRPNQR